MKSNYEDGILSCSFTRRQLTNILIPNINDSQKFDLDNAYYLLLANGPVKKIEDSQIGIAYHSGIFGSSDSSIKFSDFTIVGESGAILVKVLV